MREMLQCRPEAEYSDCSAIHSSVSQQRPAERVGTGCAYSLLLIVWPVRADLSSATVALPIWYAYASNVCTSVREFEIASTRKGQRKGAASLGKWQRQLVRQYDWSGGTGLRYSKSLFRHPTIGWWARNLFSVP